MARRLLCSGEDPRDVRNRIVQQILGKHPELADDLEFAMNNRGVVFPFRYSDVAELIAEAMQLADIEQGFYPERFIKTDEPNSLKRRYLDESLLTFWDRLAVEPGVAGGKGASLARLTRNHFPVPTGIIVGASGYRAFLHTIPGFSQRIAALKLDDAATLHAQCAELRRLLQAIPLPIELAASLRIRLPPLLALG
ncbi:MAG: PEP/pyruvate-binding domain-containing protein, partial [Longimicrobiales bacterium]